MKKKIVGTYNVYQQHGKGLKTIRKNVMSTDTYPADGSVAAKALESLCPASSAVPNTLVQLA